MNNLLVFFQKTSHWFLFILLEVVSLTLLFKYNNYQGSVWFTSANAVSGAIYDYSSRAEHFFALSTVNEELTMRNLELEEENNTLREQLADIKADSTAVSTNLAASLAGLRTIGAKVVGSTLDRDDNLLTINRGSADGVKEDMGVVSGNGAVGIVYMVSPHYSIVIPILNTRSEISCTIASRGYFGTLRWHGDDPRTAYLEDIPRHARFKLNDAVVTSGYSAVFPRGLRVGKILHVYNSPDGLSYMAQVQLSTDFGNLRDVLVIDSKPLQQQLEFTNAAKDSLDKQKGK